MTDIPLRVNEPDQTVQAQVFLAHGAGAPMDSPFMEETAELICQKASVRIVRFEFPYMAEPRTTGKKRPPDKAEKLLSFWDSLLKRQASSGLPLFLAGKSMGGRMASHLPLLSSCTAEIAGVFCLGYPFHPPGKPEKLRTEHLADFPLPMLIAQGTRDPFGTRDDITGYKLSPTIEFAWAEDGNHDLAPRKASGLTQADNLKLVSDAIATFISEVLKSKG
ncbi:alpha/beta family hydrolase [Kiloniella sp. b19]|uniref:alpha/beta family hydrolase n=1 Tax=Kiloniella sp. GXU_MW_B19 TaxID=3141326 RepID=UPI0031DA4357